MICPTLQSAAQGRVTTEVFRGLDRRPEAPDGAFADCMNMSSRLFPLASQRHARGVAAQLSAPGGVMGKDALAWVDGGTLYLGGEPTGLTGLGPGEKQLVSMGARIIVFPDKKYFNTADPSDFGSLEASYASQGAVSAEPCTEDGTPILPDLSPLRPESAESGSYWADTDGRKLYRCTAEGVWSEVGTVCTRFTFTSLGAIGAAFSALDGVTVSGTGSCDGEKLILALGGSAEERDWIVLTGFCAAPASVEGTVRLRREVPELDFVVQCRNRLWGCFYGRRGTRTVNEICCCALGDPKNWRRFEGLSTDSWTASVGSDGEWTGAVNYLGTPVFFKERTLHRVTVSPVGAHSVGETVCRGVKKGSAKSLCVMGETLYYHGRGGIFAWQGGFPERVSAALGEAEMSNVCAGACGGKLYVSGLCGGTRSLYVLDSERGVWEREDDPGTAAFTETRGELWCLCSDGRVVAMSGAYGLRESGVDWSFTSGAMHYGIPEEKYVSRILLRMSLESGASASIEAEYDSSGVWEEAGSVTGSGALRSFLLPIVPRRCDHMRLRVSGRGEMRLYSLSRVLERGSDIPEAGGESDV